MEEKINNFFSGAENIIKDLTEKKKKYLESLKSLPYKSETFPIEELKQLQHINLFLNFAMERFENEIKVLEMDFGKNGQKDPDSFTKAKNDTEQRVLSDLMITLDPLDVWSHKFSTESQGTGENLTETPNDSVYYMTSFGASLRLKMTNKIVNKGEGIKKVIQPIMEKIFFEKPGEEISETPKLGYFVREYTTQDFLDKLAVESTDSDYQSSVRKYERGGKIEIPKLDNIKIDHEGSPVNRIYF